LEPVCSSISGGVSDNDDAMLLVAEVVLNIGRNAQA
jgi:hypothetical protein